MPKQKGPMKFEGTFDGLTYYRTQEDGYLVRNKSGISKNRIKTDPVFEGAAKIMKSLAQRPRLPESFGRQFSA